MYSTSRQNNQFPVPAASQIPPKQDGTLPSIHSSPQDHSAAMSYPPPVQQPPPPPPQQQQQPLYAQAQPPPAVAVDVLKPYNGRKGDRIYKLSVEQQPIRARMCGFGDKDRRPITPPPCIRLIVCDATTGKEIDYQEVDSTFFVLTVDLWDQDGNREVNLVRHSSGAPTVSISSSTTTSYPPPPERPQLSYMAQSPIMAPQYDQYGRQVAAPPQAQAANPYTPGPHMHGNYYGQQPTNPGYNPYASQAYNAMSMPVAPPPTAATGMFTRNLIGSLTVNAFRLTDTEGKIGFWFVLQDLSVRTEGIFRLKMNFVDVGAGNSTSSCLNTGRAPVLATCFSDQFQVYSAKKFPGVIESTPLSKAFASQGIKIPIRKDGPKTLTNQAEYDADD